MAFLDKLQRRFGRYAVPRLTEGLIACQAVAFFLGQGNPAFSQRIALIPRLVLHGEPWRLVTFVCDPPAQNLLFAFFFWYFFYMLGTVLEQTWGAFRYNVFLLVGWLATIAASFLQPNAPASIAFLQGSVFLAFAYLYPNFQILLFFILPVKVKWLAFLQWLVYFFAVVAGNWMTRLAILASVLNFALFFWHDIYLRIKSGQRRMTQQTQSIRQANTPHHTCSVCGATDLSDPNMNFRYCSKCAGAPCYCTNHIHTHQHVGTTEAAESA
jgi:membrane associated rhomboid family serine protease